MVNIYEILGKIGFDWQVALANLVNFLIILFVLRKFAFNPIKKLIQERQGKIDEGLEKAEEASIRLKEINVMAKNKLKQVDLDAMDIIKKTEKQAKILEDNLQKESENRQKELMEQIQLEHKKHQEEAKELVYKEASELVKKTIKKTVELSPEAIDDALIKKAVLKIKNNEI
ncbi:MAG: ATP synthase F0 subunit B [Candidatus Staskawiczbacteria bacterium]|nr:ATP synthase F0 subunit B [Candidatus Staskawiczbacteria bacterium]MBI3337036.1 ATP synthase F0 subunit B [Candidatus Staskawiczbacteria bacterium]